MNIKELRAINVKGEKFVKVSIMGNKVIFKKENTNKIMTLEMKENFVQAKMVGHNTGKSVQQVYAYFRVQKEKFVPCSFNDVKGVFDVRILNIQKISRALQRQIEQEDKEFNISIFTDDETYYAKSMKKSETKNYIED